MMMKKVVFKDRDLQERYNKDGYVLLKVFDEYQLRHLRQLHDSVFAGVSSLPNCYNTSDHLSDSLSRKFLANELKAAFAGFFHEYLNGFKPVYLNYIGKRPGEDSSRELHQDYNFCDE